MAHQNPNCDGSGPCSGEVRLLPLTPGSNLHLCFACCTREYTYRRIRNRSLSDAAKFALPAWESLEVKEI